MAQENGDKQRNSIAIGRITSSPSLKAPLKPATLESVKQANTARRVSAPTRGLRGRTRAASARPSSEFKLTRKERAILADPDWVTEDEADIIYCMRHEHEPTIPLEEVAKELGLPLEN